MYCSGGEVPCTSKKHSVVRIFGWILSQVHLGHKNVQLGVFFETCGHYSEDGSESKTNAGYMNRILEGHNSLPSVLKDFVIPNTELIPEEVRSKVRKWSDYIDYWAVDWDFQDDTFMPGWREDTSGRRPSSLLLVPKIRTAVDAWREQGYPGASDETRRLFEYWFEEDHEVETGRCPEHFRDSLPRDGIAI